MAAPTTTMGGLSYGGVLAQAYFDGMLCSLTFLIANSRCIVRGTSEVANAIRESIQLGQAKAHATGRQMGG